jgi:hypothetical protein
MNIAAGLSATKTGFDLIKSARELLTRPDVNPAEVQARLLELQALMLEAQRALGDAEEEIRILKASSRSIEGRLRDRSRSGICGDCLLEARGQRAIGWAILSYVLG